jgi:hypothetical protein|tara:strand:- start:400 stop:1374 length:975 start_codon:yes stop_codon:yes gene_type:complete
MSKYLNVPNGNYKVAVQDGGTIYLDTGVRTGTVEISGNLLVKGVQTTVNTTQLDIADNIITLNSGETGAGITLNDAGFKIERGTLPDTFFKYDEDVAGFIAIDEASQLISLATNEIDSRSQNLLLNAGTSTVNVSPTVDYEQKVFTYAAGELTGYNASKADTIPNTQAVVDYVAYNFANVFLSQIGDGDVTKSSIVIADFENSGVDSVITFAIDGNTVSQLYADRWEFDEIRFAGSTIETISSNEDLVLKSAGTGSIRIDDTLHLNRVPSENDESLEPIAPADGTKIYVADEYTGKSGIFFANDQGSRDELVSKNRALLFGMLF